MILFETTRDFSWPGQNIDDVQRAVKTTDEDVAAQGERLHQNTLSLGYRFPKIDHTNFTSDPIVHWTGGGSKKITALALDLHSGMSREAAAAKHGSDVLQMHDRLIGEINKAPPLPEDVHCYSGVCETVGQHLNAVTEKGVYKNPAPMPVSLHPSIAYRRGLAGHVVNIFMQSGTSPGLYIGGTKNHAFHHESGLPEYEMIMKPKRTLFLVGRQKSVLPHGAPLTVHNFVDVTDK